MRGEGSWKFWQEAEILGIFSIEVAHNIIVSQFKQNLAVFQLQKMLHTNVEEIYHDL